MTRPLLLLYCLIQLPVVFAAEVRVATVQFDSVNGDFDGNLAEVAKYVRNAKVQEADVTLLPEFALIGYDLSPEIWEMAEHAGGPTQQALSTLAQEAEMYIGTSFLEVEGNQFFNTFILVSPQGDLVGRVRKQVPAGANVDRACCPY